MLDEIERRLRFKADLKPKCRIVLETRNLRYVLEEDGARLLEAVKRFGSISMAAKHVGLDYRLAWMKISGLEKAFGFKVVDRVLGGVGGGSARLTLEGEVLLQKYLLAERKLKQFSGTQDLLKPDLNVMGSHCPALEILIKMIEERYEKFFIEYATIGSENGLKLVLKKIADVSGVHIFDKESNSYNEFLLKNNKFGKKLALIKGYFREQGLIVRKGNPKKIYSIEDLLRKEVTFINRNRGSGTRLLLDALVEKLALDKRIAFKHAVRNIRGYGSEANSHLEVATAIIYGKADAGLGIKASANAFNLDFIPLQREAFDFVALKENANKEKIKRFVEVLLSKKFQSEIRKKDYGIEFHSETGKILE